MNIGEAIGAVILGKKVARQGWNGRGMYIFLITGDQVTLRSGIDTGPGVGMSIALRTPTGFIQPGWNASTPDLLALDWEIVGE